MKQKKQKRKYIDDGHTIYNMNIEGMPGYMPKKDDNVSLTKRERKALISAALAHYFPILLIVIGSFFLALLLILLWLN